MSTSMEEFKLPVPGWHPKCKGFKYDTSYGPEYDCEYSTTITCDECRYCASNNGKGKNPMAKRNQFKC